MSVRSSVRVESVTPSAALLTVTPAEFWEHSIAVAITASEIVRRTSGLEADAAFTMGLLHDVGRILLAEAVPDAYGDVLQQAESLSLPLEHVERRMLLTTHAGVLNNVLSAWGMPNQLIEPITGHHLGMGSIRSGSPSSVRPTAVVALANRFVHSMGIGSSGNRTVYSTDEFFEALELPRATLAQLVESVPDMVDDLKLAMLSDVSTANSGSRFAGGHYVSSSDETDAIRTLFRQHDGDEVALYAVVRFRSDRDRAPLTSRLVEYERSHQTGPLPVLLISTSGETRLQDNHMNRRHALVPLPVTKSRVAACIDTITGLTEAERKSRLATAV